MKTPVVLFTICLLICSTDCKQKKGGKKVESEKNSSSASLCDDGEKENRPICFCTPSEANDGFSVVCWMNFNVTSEDDPVWKNFESRSDLVNLTINTYGNNVLSIVPTKIFHHLPRLQGLEMRYGSVKRLTSFVFSNSTSITSITIVDSKIAELDPYAVSHLPNLTAFDLEFSDVSELKKDSIRDLPSLKRLKLIGSNLSIIHEGAFETLGSLIDLELNQNKLSAVSRKTFSGLASLRYLDLRNNSLKAIEDYSFRELTKLETLDLEDNAIEHVSANGFSGLRKLSKLRLDRNRLKTLGSDVFKDTPSISRLDLRLNPLERLTRETLEPIWANLRNATSYLTLDKNQLKCDCHLSWVHSLMNETESATVRFSLEELTCLEDEPETSSIAPPTEPPQEDEPYVRDQTDVDEYEDYENESTERESEAEKSPRRKILDFSPNALPCPETPIGNAESSMEFGGSGYRQEASSSTSGSNGEGSSRSRFDHLLPACLAALGTVSFRR